MYYKHSYIFDFVFNLVHTKAGPHPIQSSIRKLMLALPGGIYAYKLFYIFFTSFHLTFVFIFLPYSLVFLPQSLHFDICHRPSLSISIHPFFSMPFSGGTGYLSSLYLQLWGPCIVLIDGPNHWCATARRHKPDSFLVAEQDTLLFFYCFQTASMCGYAGGERDTGEGEEVKGEEEEDGKGRRKVQKEQQQMLLGCP